MVYADTILDGLTAALSESHRLDSEMTYAIVELDAGGEHANVSLPIVEMTIDDISRDQSKNTAVVGYETNANGNRIGHIYRHAFELEITCDVTTAAGSGVDPRAQVQRAREVLSLYDTRTRHRQIPHPDGGGITEADLVVGDRSPANDFSTTPSLRTERLDLFSEFTHELKESELDEARSPVTAVVTPDAIGTNPDGSSVI